MDDKVKEKSRLLYFILGPIVVLALFWDMIPLPDAHSRLGSIPLDGLRYHMRDVSLTANEKEIFGDATVVKRLVRCIDQPPLLMTILSGSGNQHIVHDPTYCLAGAGWQIVAENPLTIQGGNARWLRLKHKTADSTREIEVIYWYSNGRQHYSSPTDLWKDRILYRLTLGRANRGPILVLLQTIGDEGDVPDWERIAEEIGPVQEL